MGSNPTAGTTFHLPRLNVEPPQSHSPVVIDRLLSERPPPATHLSWISNKLSGSDLQENLRSQVASSISLVDYHGRAVILVKISCPEGPFFFEGAIYERNGSGTVMVPQGAHYRRIYQKFV